jgi:predicted metalloprotease
MRITFKHLIVTIAALVAGAVLAGHAAAMSPAQTNSWYLANTIQFNQQTGATPYGSIEHFWSTTLRSWGYTYYRPGLIWYGDYFGNRNTGCTEPNGLAVNTANRRQNGFYCSVDGTVYLDYEYMNSLIGQFGDFGSGGFMAHEWGHRIQHVLGRRGSQTFQGEYHADCLAGMYTRWGYMTGLLGGADYWEFSNWLSSQRNSASHGSGANRAAWFKYGYTEYNLGKCDYAYNLSVAFAHTKGKKASLKPPPTKRKLNLRPRNIGLPTGTTAVPAAQNGSPRGVAVSGQDTTGFDSLLSLF